MPLAEKIARVPTQYAVVQQPYPERAFIVTLSCYRQTVHENLSQTLAQGGAPEIIAIDQKDAPQLLSKHKHHLPCISIPEAPAFMIMRAVLSITKELENNKIQEYAIASDTFNRIPSIHAEPLLIQKHASQIEYIYSNLADEESRDIFLRLIKARVTGDISYIRPSSYRQYRHPHVDAYTGDSICEGGLFNGSSTLEYAWLTGPGGIVTGFEPEPDAARISQATCREHSSYVHIEPLGLWSCPATFRIQQAERGGSFFTESGGSLCQATDLDSYLQTHGRQCDLIKLDIEGAEIPCLHGAVNTIKTHAPKLQISIYHKPDDLFDIPQLLMGADAPYRFYMGHHSIGLNETIFYATTDAADVAGARISQARKNARQGLARRQAQENENIRKRAQSLKGKELVFYGAGRALLHYLPIFKECRPVAITMDDDFFSPDTPAALQGIPLVKYTELPPEQRRLPLVVCAQEQFAAELILRLGSSHPQIIRCALYSGDAMIEPA